MKPRAARRSLPPVQDGHPGYPRHSGHPGHPEGRRQLAGPAAIGAALERGEPLRLIVLNGESVPKSERASRRLADGDLLAIMPPLRGG